ncbi:hypothetical protein [Agromyces sp. CCNWLW203]|uniref:hypothetical protein n=1 Tax=Agromyces sp. CCNWLW203 TaxID=3112842 RepID=UPI002F96A737
MIIVSTLAVVAVAGGAASAIYMAGDNAVHDAAWTACVDANYAPYENAMGGDPVDYLVQAAQQCERHTEDALRSYLDR